MRPLINPLLILPLLPLGSLQARDAIEAIPLDATAVVVVPVATNRVTTVGFPGSIAAIDAAGVSMDPKVPGSFQLAHTAGAAFLSVRALEGKGSANLNVRYDGRTYVFLLQESATPVLCLNMVERQEPVAHPAPRLSTTQLLALLDKAKAFPLLHAQHPESVEGTLVRTFEDRERLTEYGEFAVRLEEVFRFNAEDTLVFRVTLLNRMDQVLNYDPGSFQVRAGNRLYPQAISDGTGQVPANAEATLYVAIAGSPDGGRNELSIQNEFRVLVQRVQTAPQAPPTSPTSPSSQTP